MTAEVFLPGPLRAKGYELVWRAETGSTNADGLDALRAGQCAPPCWFVAGRQTAGRGRHGREWVSPAGNLYASLLLGNPCEVAIAAQLGFIAGIAVHDAISGLTGLSAPRLVLKWPNDVLLDGAKLVGLLLEARSVGRDLHVAIGWGINVAARPAATPYPAATLHNVRPDMTIAAVFEALSLSFDAVFTQWRRTGGQPPARRFAAIRTLWLERAGGIGGPASVRLPSGTVSGTFAGIDAVGRLELQTDSGVERIDAGDLFFAGMAK